MTAEITTMLPVMKNKQPIAAPIAMMVGMSHLLSKGTRIIHYGSILFKGGGIPQREAELLGP